MNESIYCVFVFILHFPIRKKKTKREKIRRNRKLKANGDDKRKWTDRQTDRQTFRLRKK